MKPTIALQDIERLTLGGEFWTPAKIAEPRLVLGYECIVRGHLFALESEVYSPGPFDTLSDVAAAYARTFQKVQEHVISGSGG